METQGRAARGGEHGGMEPWQSRRGWLVVAAVLLFLVGLVVVSSWAERQCSGPNAADCREYRRGGD